MRYLITTTDDAVPVRRRRGRPATKTPEERRAVQLEATRRWRAANGDRVKAQNDKTNGRLKAEWAAKRAQRVPMDLLKTGIGTPLSLFLAEQCIAEDCDLHDVTVMASITDPFRWDRGLAHKESRWFSKHLEEVAPGRSVHLRAVHYAMLGRSFRLPNGNVYINTNENYMWPNNAAKSARWPGYVPFDRITDERNETPLILVPEDTRPRSPQAWVSADAPELSRWQLLPYVVTRGAVAPQPFRLALIAEKSSAREELEPLARRYGAELLLPSGHLSDRIIYDLCRRGAKHGRPLVCLYATDCDPSGWSMPIVLAGKFQGHRLLSFPGLQAIVHHVGLLNNLANATLALRMEKTLAGVLGYDEFANEQMLMSPLPKPTDARKGDDDDHTEESFEPRPLTDEDAHRSKHPKPQQCGGGNRHCVPRKFVSSGQGMARGARAGARLQLSRHMGIICLGCEDTPYHRRSARYFILAAIARIYDPGCKFDYCPILENAQQGTQKSTACGTLFAAFKIEMGCRNWRTPFIQQVSSRRGKAFPLAAA